MTDAINSHSRRMYNAQKNTRADLTNPAPAVKVKALVEAGEVWIAARANTVGDALTPDRWTELSKAESALCAAISALEENK